MLDVKFWSSSGWDVVHGTGWGQMPKELTTEVVRGCLYTWMLIGRLDGRTPPEITLITSLNLLREKRCTNLPGPTVCDKLTAPPVKS